MSAVLQSAEIELNGHAVVFRRATPYDVEGVTQLGLEALAKFGDDRLVVDENKVREVAREVISGAGNYCCVAERDGRIVAAVSALVHEQIFHERKVATVVQFYSKEPGAGVRLMREFLRWARSRPGIKSIVWTVEANARPAIGKLLARLGMHEEHPVWVEIK
jgi:ribosomal protein S18 acetylase RimI-like enzyme